MIPFFSKRNPHSGHTHHKQKIHPLEDPLNHEDQRDFLFLLERWRATKQVIGRLFEG